MTTSPNLEEGATIRAAAVAPVHVLAGHLPLEAACDRVCEKAGMPGVDGVSTQRLARERDMCLDGLRRALASGAYRPLPLRLAQIEKTGGVRTLLVPAAIDRVAQTAAAFWLASRWNPAFDAASFAYRPGLGVRDALRRVAELRSEGFVWVFDADLRAFFDTIDHDRLIKAAARSLGERSPALAWISLWVRGVVWDGTRLRRIAQGVPQGSPISPLLANFFLHPFDVAMRRHGLHLVRYADDFVVMARTPFELTDIAKAVADCLDSLGLTLNPSKTRMTSCAQGWRFLGAEIDASHILVPIEKRKTRGRLLYVAPLMPPALRRAWIAGDLGAAGAPFVPGEALTNIPPERNSFARRAGASTLDTIRGRRAPRELLAGGPLK